MWAVVTVSGVGSLGLSPFRYDDDDDDKDNNDNNFAAFSLTVPLQLSCLFSSMYSSPCVPFSPSPSSSSS